MGAGSELNAWRRTGYTDALKNEYSLVLFDIRGHGKSDKPHEASAEGSNTVDDVVAVLDSLDIEEAHFFGYSMGASVGFRQAVHHPDRFRSFILGGMTPGPWPEEMVKAMEISRELVKLRRTDPEAYFTRMEQMLGHSLTPAEKSELLSRDSGAEMESMTPRRQESALTDRDLAAITVPCLLYCGDQDPFHNGAQRSVEFMPRAAFVSMHGLNHITAFFRSDVVVPLVKQFLTLVGRM
jgi:pimeloyl-ACP methyl ester carboxylesterase